MSRTGQIRVWGVHACASRALCVWSTHTTSGHNCTHLLVRGLQLVVDCAQVAARLRSGGRPGVCGGAERDAQVGCCALGA